MDDDTGWPAEAPVPAPDEQVDPIRNVVAQLEPAAVNRPRERRGQARLSRPELPQQPSCVWIAVAAAVS